MNKYLHSLQWLGVALFALCLAPSSPVQAAHASTKGVVGYWKHTDEDTGKTRSIFQVWESKGKLLGRIVKTFPKPGGKPQTVCDECSGWQKNKPVVGLIFFWNFVPDEDNPKKWVDGRILNPEDGNTYNAEAELSPDGSTLKVFGFIRVLVKLGGTSEWKRPTPDELRDIAK